MSLSTDSRFRVLVIIAGALAVSGYAILGAASMNDWEMTAASHLPLDQTVAHMRAAEQPVSAIPGLLFAATGISLAVAWASLLLAKRLSIFASIVGWAAIIAFGAPAYFWFSFGNMMSVGDTFPDWDSEAAIAIADRFYLASGIALAVGIVAASVLVVRVLVRRSAPIPRA
ncbi:hypothetical protein [Leucobacter iarius]|uniref:DUF1772 domain-containing protein n=1 Tax=Leucobacter iarius TaxID=333963 RepID=A0ABN2LJX3_9MICO